MFDHKSWLAAVCALAAGCGGSGGSQVITGRVDPRVAVAVRAVTSTDVVAAGRLDGNGAFALNLPPGATYRLELLTAGGAVPLVGYSGGTWKPLEVRICEAVAPFDIGGIVTASTVEPCDPMDPNAMCVPPSECTDPATGEMCDPAPPPECDPMDPMTMCPPPPDPCDPMTGACEDPCITDPATCGCTEMDPMCWPPPEPNPCGEGLMCDPAESVTPQHLPTALGCED